jgi:hypothetical protein
MQWVIAGFRAITRNGRYVMRSVFGRAMVVAGAVVVALGPAAGVAAAAPRPPALAFTPAPYDYGQVAAGQAASHTFTLANTGGQGTGKLAVTLAGSAAFTITGDTCQSLAPGKTCTVTVRFAAAQVGAVAATLTAEAKKRQVVATDNLTGSAGLGAAAPRHLYWVIPGNGSPGTGSIWEAGLDGSGPHAIATGQTNPFAVAVDASHLYWTDSGATTFPDGSVWEAGPDGSNPHAIITGQKDTTGVALSGSHLYWANFNDGSIWEAGLDGSNPQRIISQSEVPSNSPYALAVGTSHIYWMNLNGGSSPTNSIWEANLDGSNPQSLVTVPNGPTALAVDASHIYWGAQDATGFGGALWEAGLDGNNPHTFVTGGDFPAGMAVDPGNVYWTTIGDGSDGAGGIWAAGLDGTGAHTLVTGQSIPEAIAVTPPPAALAFTPAPFDYGQVGTGQASSPQTFTLANTGGQATGALTDTLTGSAAFTLTGDTCTGISLAPGETCTVTVRFAPASISTFAATLTAASADPAVTATDALTGTGVRPRLLYWTSERGAINMIPLTGAGPPAALFSHRSPLTGVAVDASHIYWANSPTSLALPNIREATLTDTNETILVSATEGLDSPAGLAVDASHIYWADSANGMVAEKALAGGLTKTLYVSSKSTAPTGVAVDSSHVYWANSGTGTINEVPLTGGPVTTLATGQASPWGVAVDSGHVYWANSGTGTINEVPLTGGPVTTLVTGQDNPEGLAVDSGHIYWANNDMNGTINEAPLAGGPVTVLATGQAYPVGVAVSP